jgi:hypothetical protein
MHNQEHIFQTQIKVINLINNKKDFKVNSPITYMKNNHLMTVLIILAILFGIIGYISLNQKSENVCNSLKIKLDEKITDTNNPPGRFVIGGFDGIVGGTLTNIEDNGLDRGYQSYILTFKGKNNEGTLYLMTDPERNLPYKIGEFYQFDLSNKNQYSAALHGSFMDYNLDKLIPINC